MTQDTAYMVDERKPEMEPMLPLSADERAAIIEAVRDFAAVRARAARAGVGRAEALPARGAAAGRRARTRRHLRARGRRRLGPQPLRHGRDRRGARQGRPLDRRLHLDPQHGRVDDRHVRHRRAAPRVAAAPDRDDRLRQLLPHRAGRRFGCRGHHDQRDPRRRRLRPHRGQAVHLGRRRGVRLRRHGPHRRARCPRDLRVPRARRHRRPVVRRRTRRRWAGTPSPRAR